jgi:hypothetical protein
VQRDERRRTRRVHGDRGALQPECVGDAAGDHARGGAGHDEALGGRAEQGRVVGVGGTEVHAGRRTREGARVEPGAFDRLPRDLQHHALLGVHGDGLARGDAEELGVEVGGVG